MKQTTTRSRMIKWLPNCLSALSTLAVMSMVFTPWQNVQACSRILYETGTGTYIVGRTMDWADPSVEVALWLLPRGLEREGDVGKNPLRWTSKYGSMIISMYDIGTNDGMNEKGLIVNTLYLAESEYGDPAKRGKPTISVCAWAQYFLDNYATVKEAVEAMKDDPFTVTTLTFPNGRKALGHLSISDPTGDSAILEYLEGKLVIHHGPQYKVMTNSPTYDQQLALNDYWDLIGGNKFLPGTISPADRFVRLSYVLKVSEKYKDPKLALASVFSQIRAISVPLSLSDPDKPNVSMTLWRSIMDHSEKMYYFETALMPTVTWVDLKKVDFRKGSGARKIQIDAKTDLSGEVSKEFKPAEPFTWIK